MKQRVQMVKMIKSLCQSDKYVFVIEHDMAVVDYLADIVCIVYGYPSAYGFATLPVSCRDGINQYLDGYIKSDNMRIRDKPLKFSVIIYSIRNSNQLLTIHLCKYVFTK